MDPFWEKKFRGQPLSLTMEDLTVKRLRKLKELFGDEYGIPGRFLYLLSHAEGDALTAALWIHSEKAGDPIGAPLDYEFNLGEFEEPDKPKRRPGKRAAAEGTEDPTTSAETQTS